MATDAAAAAALFAVDPAGLGGVAVRARAGPARDAWLSRLRSLLPDGAPWRRVPLHVSDERLLGGLDLAATLQAGRPVAQRGLLSEADGGVVLLAMAERLPPATAAHLAGVIDTREVVMERDGLGTRSPSRIGLVALDEGIDDDERLAPRLLERLAFHLGEPPADAGSVVTPEDVSAARGMLGAVRASPEIIEALCAAALALGVASARAPVLAWRAARAAAALDGRDTVSTDDAALAARLVLAPRATQLPPPPTEQDAPDEPEDIDETPPSQAATPPETDTRSSDESADGGDDKGGDPGDNPSQSAPDEPPSDANDNRPSSPEPDTLDDVVLASARAAIPAGLLAALQAGLGVVSRSPAAGRAGAVQAGTRRGRPSGVRRGEPRAGARLNLIETLRAAAPWQALRRREAAKNEAAGAGKDRSGGAGGVGRDGAGAVWSEGADGTGLTESSASARIQVRREDFHVTRYQQRGETTTLFVVDASGSAALHRLAETKGAVELLLADCYIRRDSVAVLAFRGRAAELLLPPTRSLVRAKRCLDGLPGGGGTPLAAGIDGALALCESLRRKGNSPVVVLLTDGRANIARDGSPGRARANDDALAAARQLRLSGVTALLLDTSPQPQDTARELAAAMGARYLPLPHADAARLSQAVRAATAR